VGAGDEVEGRADKNVPVDQQRNGMSQRPTVL